MKIYKVKVNGKVYEVEIESMTESTNKIEVPTKDVSTPSGEVLEIKAPMAGTILDCLVKVGDKVSVGDVVAILEAMKLENEIVSTVEGTVKSVLVNKGQSVSNQEVIILVG